MDAADGLTAIPKRQLWLYLLPLALGPLLVFVAAFFVIPSRWFEMRSGDTYLANLGYGAQLKGADCQVIVYGDSTAMVGLDPKIVAARTGLTACNIAEFAGVTLVSGTQPVDKYLTQNARPKYIVFLYAPEDLARPHAWENVGVFEAISYRVEQEKDWGTAAELAAHPDKTLGWAEQGMRIALTKVRSKPFPEEKAHVRERDGGQLKLVGPDLTSCSGDTRMWPPDPAWVKHLRERYAVGGTRVIVDATPAIECDPGLWYYKEHLPGLVDDWPLPLYPVGDYVDVHGTRMHMNAKGSAKVSAMVAAQVNALERGTGR